ncbi:MAG: DUF4258 domain-containing protein [Ferruginibacter sp.]
MFPFLALLAAILLFVWIKKNQRGPTKSHDNQEQTIPSGANEFDRTINHIVYSRHAKCRMACRHIDETEVKEILSSGTLNYQKIEEDEKGKTYPLEGITHDKQHVRIVFAPHQQELVVVTVVDLDREWPCNCN